MVEVEPGRWLLALRRGLVLEVVLAGGRSWGSWRWRGELVGEVSSGEA